ncbi:copper homeostasis protein CutC (macronuclear) [Tetrahymena thermophila SB210]|uniref:Copper homeostasis protein cutC homolog n=1 Tax=Tetrahymena thermophila (strain SB210) TaxID=312017 RepID=Q22Y19_TETTS|nr:copper homeostasis protein CutC [Tetrahymena thermophila SB210]EAR90205.1 copper homeostasis protein CutC [Tetrahymena thermophila SB210]|eukprot:XP_001010450.1 copper homeostasis protein CutC [Tetrahymena thermophila SB210]
MQQNILLESCTESYTQSLEAQNRGAHRIELCDNLAQGGTTPSYGTIKICKERLNIPQSVMIRPRGGDFTYSKDELDIMREDIKICKQLNVDGVVFGFLTKDQKQIDFELTKEFVELSAPLKVTFHMAFDEVDDQFQALEKLIELKVTRILTKGGKFKNALEGQEVLKKLIEQANGRIEVMPGKGINSQNYKQLAEFTKATQLHGTQIV